MQCSTVSHQYRQNMATLSTCNLQTNVAPRWVTLVGIQTEYPCRIDRAFPVQEVQSKESMPSVQMVEADVKAVRQKISKSHGLRYD